MKKINTGGPAFPVADPLNLSPINKTELQSFAGGMTLRDYFAAKAMQGLCADLFEGRQVEMIPELAYAIADGMLIMREES